MKTKHVLRTLMIAMILVPCMVVMTACFGGSGGFKTQDDLIDAALKLEKSVTTASYDAKYPKFSDIMKFEDNSSATSLLMEIAEASYNAKIAEAKREVKLMKNGEYETEEWDSEAKAFKKMPKAEYDTALKAVQDQAASLKITDKKKDNDKTDAVKSNSKYRNKVVEVWNVDYEMQNYDIKTGEKVGDLQKETAVFTIVKIDGKWFVDGIVGGLDSFLSFLSIM